MGCCCWRWQGSRTWDEGEQPELALEIFEGMKQRGLAPYAVVYSALIGACEKGDQLK